MHIKDLFNARPSTAQPPPASDVVEKDLTSRGLEDSEVSSLMPALRGGAAGMGGDSVPVFLTPQALMSFPVATLAIKLVDIVVDSVFPDIAQSNLVPFLASLLIGGLIIFYTWDNNRPLKDRVLHGVVGVLNILYLYAVSIGLPIPSVPTPPGG